MRKPACLTRLFAILATQVLLLLPLAASGQPAPANSSLALRSGAHYFEQSGRQLCQVSPALVQEFRPW